MDEAHALIRRGGIVAQRKLDGERCIVTICNGSVSAVNRVGKELEIQGIPSVRSCVLDGELVAGVFTPFDILELDGKNIRNLQFCLRINILESLGFECVEIFRVDLLSGIEHARAEGWEGLVFKSLDGDYKEVGREYRPTTWKLKFKKTGSFIVSGQTGKDSVFISTFDGVERGKVTVRGASTLENGAVIEVEYLAVHKSGKLREPIYRGRRNDCPPNRCLVPKL